MVRQRLGSAVSIGKLSVRAMFLGRCKDSNTVVRCLQENLVVITEWPV